jgi:hypothetical protein
LTGSKLFVTWLNPAVATKKVARVSNDFFIILKLIKINKSSIEFNIYDLKETINIANLDKKKELPKKYIKNIYIKNAHPLIVNVHDVL